LHFDASENHKAGRDFLAVLALPVLAFAKANAGAPAVLVYELNTGGFEGMAQLRARIIG
jgi:hypothetical protein